MALAEAGGEILVGASVHDTEDDITKPTIKQILNQTMPNYCSSTDESKWIDKSVIDVTKGFHANDIKLAAPVLMRRVLEKKNIKKTEDGNVKTCNWKGPILFLQEGPEIKKRSQVLCIKDVLVAACPEEGETYGKTFVYVGLHEGIRSYLECFMENGNDDEIVRESFEEPPFVFDEARFLPDSKIWWRTTRSVKNLATTIATNEDGDVVRTSHSVADILKKTGKGFTITAYVKFAVCAKTTHRHGLKNTTLRAVSVDVMHGVLQNVNDSREGPVLAPAFSAVNHRSNGLPMPDMGSVQNNNKAVPGTKCDEDKSKDCSPSISS